MSASNQQESTFEPFQRNDRCKMEKNGGQLEKTQTIRRVSTHLALTEKNR